MFCSSFICWAKRFVHSIECSVDISFSFGLWSRWESLFVRVCRLESMFGDTKNPLDLLLSLNKPVVMSMTSSLSSSDYFVVSLLPFASFVSFVRMLAFRCSFTPFALPRENCSPLPSCSRFFSSLRLEDRFVCDSSRYSSNALRNQSDEVRHQWIDWRIGCSRSSRFCSVHLVGGVHLSEHVSVDYQRQFSSCSRERHSSDQGMFTFIFNRFLLGTGKNRVIWRDKRSWSWWFCRLGLRKVATEERYEERDARMRSQYLNPMELLPVRIDQLFVTLNQVCLKQVLLVHEPSCVYSFRYILIKDENWW